MRRRGVNFPGGFEPLVLCVTGAQTSPVDLNHLCCAPLGRKLPRWIWTTCVVRHWGANFPGGFEPLVLCVIGAQTHNRPEYWTKTHGRDILPWHNLYEILNYWNRMIFRYLHQIKCFIYMKLIIYISLYI